ncbi:N-acetylmuramoyl-L-alanine amidase [Streptomyces sp. NPDC001568]|uniref:peptidoglycan recognition protein family protein n=1 Tax=Streptomyces sp. NPDC001568 TaxID=3364588 RepID=UPI0036C9ED8E
MRRRRGRGRRRRRRRRYLFVAVLTRNTEAWKDIPPLGRDVRLIASEPAGVSHEKVRSTAHRLGWTWKPRWSGFLPQISKPRPLSQVAEGTPTPPAHGRWDRQEAQPPPAQVSVLADLCARVCRQYDAPASEIYGHRDFNSTACPGDTLSALLPKLREDVARRRGSAEPVSLPRRPEHPPLDRPADPAAVADAHSEYLPEGLLGSLRHG